MSMNTKSEIAPKGMQFNATDFRLGERYCTILTVISYPKMINIGFLSSLPSIPGVKVAIKHIPIDFALMRKMIDKEISDLKDRFQKEHDNTLKEKIRQDFESLEGFVQQLAAANSRIFDFQLHVMVTGSSDVELEQRRTEVKTFLTGMDMRAIPLMFEQEKVLKSILPIFPKQDVEDRIGTPIPSDTIAAMYPFIFDSIKDPGLSTLLGVDFSGGVVLFNQFLYQIKKENNRNNANLLILGQSGSGKSTAAKLMLRSHLRNNYKVIAIDPEGELEEMCKTFGGDFIDIGKGADFGLINPLEVVVDGDEADASQGLSYTILTRMLSTLKAFMMYYSPSIEDDVLALFSEVVQDTYKRFNIDFDTDFSKLSSNDYPTFDDVYATIRGRLLSMTEKTHEKDIMERLEIKIRPFTKELRYYFNGHTSIVPESSFVVFNIRDLMNSESSIRNALFFNILKYAWSLSLDRNVNTVLSVDEAHVLLGDRNELGAEFLAQIQRRSRKYNTGTIIITQQPTDFAAPNIIHHGKAIFDNASYYLVMGLKKQATEDLSKLIDINENEIEGIKRYSQGEGLFVCGNRRMQINVVLTQEELDSFGAGGGL